MAKSKFKQALKNLGDFLYNARKKAGFTQDEAARAIGLLSPQFISNCERGLCKPSAKYQKFIIDKCKASKNDLIKHLLTVEKIKLLDDISDATL